jgi:hypothetical protein
MSVRTHAYPATLLYNTLLPRALTLVHVVRTSVRFPVLCCTNNGARGCLRKTEVNKEPKFYPSALKDLLGFHSLKRRIYPMSELGELLSGVCRKRTGKE